MTFVYRIVLMLNMLGIMERTTNNTNRPMKYSIFILFFIFIELMLNTKVYSQQSGVDSIEIRFKGLQVYKYYINERSHYRDSSKFFKFAQWSLLVKSETMINDTVRYTSNTQLEEPYKLDVREHHAYFITVFHKGLPVIDSFYFLYSERYNYPSGLRNLIIKFVNAPLIENDSVIKIQLDSSSIKSGIFYYQDIITIYNRTNESGEYYTNVLDTNCSVVVTFYKHHPNAYTKQPTTTSGNYFIFPTIASSSLNIHLQNPDDNKLIITDLLGREVLNRSIGEGEEDISMNVASLLKGVYWVRVGSRVQKFIVQH